MELNDELIAVRAPPDADPPGAGASYLGTDDPRHPPESDGHVSARLPPGDAWHRFPMDPAACEPSGTTRPSVPQDGSRPHAERAAAVLRVTDGKHEYHAERHATNDRHEGPQREDGGHEAASAFHGRCAPPPGIADDR